MKSGMKAHAGEKAAEAAVLVTDAQELSDRFREFVRAERDRAVAIAYHMTGDVEAAKDIAQEAFLRAYRALPSFRGESKLSTWFFRILVNQVKNHRRRNWLRGRWQMLWEGRWQNEDGAEPAGENRRPDQAMGDAELRHRTAQALERLSTGQRAAFSLVHLEGMTVAESAEVLGVFPGTVKSHLHRALVKLRNELSEYMEGRS